MRREQRPPGRRAIRDIVDAERLLFQFCDYLEYLDGDFVRHLGEVVEFTGAGAGVAVTVLHTLGRVPDAFELLWKNATGDAWVTPADEALWTNEEVVFRGTNAVDFRVRIFAMEA